ncbi:putative DNA-binding domain-containing protein [Methylocystis sp. JAN1]|uniref:HvfC/BufC family peptide modification chaperone n=1 Tax=Methylocystis sp. JAN1 TaxID=3397211 RepID=UPI003FA2EF1C
MKLAEFQSLFQTRILAGPGAADAPLIEALRRSQRGAMREDLLRVYQSGYRIRLESFLYEDHPGLRALLGDDAFEALVRDFVESNPPRNRNARWYTTGLPDYMTAHPQWRDNRPALSMALFERAMVDAFDAPDAETLTIQALAGFAPEDSPRLVFAFHPSLIVLELVAGTMAAYQAFSEEDDAEESEAAAEFEADRREQGASFAPGATETVAVWRCNEETAFRELEADEYVALSEARAGRAFGEICQMAAFQQSGEIAPERLAQFLASWFEDGMAVGVSLRD